jgi:hypothetical protein
MIGIGEIECLVNGTMGWNGKLKWCKWYGLVIGNMEMVDLELDAIGSSCPMGKECQWYGW